MEGGGGADTYIHTHAHTTGEGPEVVDEAAATRCFPAVRAFWHDSLDIR